MIHITTQDTAYSLSRYGYEFCIHTSDNTSLLFNADEQDVAKPYVIKFLLLTQNCQDASIDLFYTRAQYSLKRFESLAELQSYEIIIGQWE